MSSLEDRRSALARQNTAPQAEAVVPSIAASARKNEAMGYAVMAGLASFGEASQGETRFGRIVRFAPWFVLWFAMVAPVLLFWRVVF